MNRTSHHRARSAPWLLLPLLATGCVAAVDPCAGVRGTCLAVQIEPSPTIERIDQLVLHRRGDGGDADRSIGDGAALTLPIAVAVLFATPPTAQAPATLTLTAEANGRAVASLPLAVALAAGAHGHASVQLLVQAAGADAGAPGDLGGADLGGADLAVDLADLAVPDLNVAAVVLSGASPALVNELDSLHLRFSASDPLQTALQLSASGVPSDARFTVDGGVAALDWTPSDHAAGQYPIQLTATPADPRRAVTQPFAITVRNSVDPVLNPIGAVPAQLWMAPVGDVDGDGFADLAYCSVSAPVGGPPVYKLTVAYGSVAGLPTGAYPSAQRSTTTFQGAPNSSSSGNVQVTCVGGDVDGDGYSDVLFTDLYYSPSGASGSATGAYYVVYGRPSRADSSTPEYLQLLPDSGDRFVDRQPVVGDWNGDRLADFAVLGQGSSSDDVYVLTGLFPRPASLRASVEPTGCEPAQLVGFASFVDSSKTRSQPLVWSCGSSGDAYWWEAPIYFVQPAPTHYSTVSFAYFDVCDVDGDGVDDLVVAQRDGGAPGNSSTQLTLWILYGNSSGFAPLDGNTPSVAIPYTGDAPRLACWRTHQAGALSTLAIGDTQQPAALGSGYTRPGLLHLVGVNGRTPFQAGTLANYATDPMWSGWGQWLNGVGDLNGDGLPEVAVGYQQQSNDAHQASILYGR